MLKTLGVRFSYHLQAANSSLNSLCHKPSVSVMTVLVISVALTLPTLFWVMSDNLEHLAAHWQRSGHISLYLKPLAQAEESSFLKQVQKTEGVGQVHLKSPGDGLFELQQQEGMQDIMRYLPENPLPSVIEVTPNLNISNAAQMEQLFLRLKVFPQVDQAKLDMQWINRLHAILDLVSKTTHALIALLAFAVAVIVGNTLRLAVHNSQEEIQVLKLIGATDPYIARPFLYSGLWYSLTAAILAVFFVNLFILILTTAAKQLASTYQMHFPITGLSVKQAYFLVLIAAVLGWMGARFSIKRELASIGPCN